MQAILNYNLDETMRVIPLYLMILLMVGCSARGVYDGIQVGNRNECSKLPPSQYDECIKDVEKPYDEYERERKETLSH